VTAPSTVIGFPSTPAGEQLGRLLTMLSSAEDLDVEAVVALFDPSFVEAVGGAQALVEGCAPHRGAAQTGTLVRCFSRSPHELSAVFDSPEGLWKFQATVADAPSYPIAMLHAGPTGAGSGVTWEQLLEREPAAPRITALDAALADQLDGVVEAARVAQEMPGLLAAVADRDGGLVWVRSIGVASLEPLTPPTTETTLRIGSITKTMTATLVMQLVDQGLVELDADVNTYLTAYQVCGPAGEELTVRQLLTHTSGLGNRPGVELGCAPGEEPTLADFYGPKLVGQEAPGNTFAYSNDAFTTLGQLVSDVTGLPLDKHAEAALFEPLGMHDTSYTREGGNGPGIFQGLDVDAGELAPVPFQGIITQGAGSVFSTLNDMALYGAAIHGRGSTARGRVLSEESFELLTSPAVDVQGTPPGTSMCLAWLRVDLPGASMLWHNGGWPGARSEIGVLPDAGYTVLVFTNTLAADVDSVCMQLAAVLSQG
jgi:CubicO group peptidase (beta-lactamase class C family)